MGLSHRQVFLQSSPSPLKLPEADIEQSSLENNLKRQRKVSQMMGDHHLPEDACPKRDEKKSWADAFSSTSGGICSRGWWQSWETRGCSNGTRDSPDVNLRGSSPSPRSPHTETSFASNEPAKVLVFAGDQRCLS